MCQESRRIEQPDKVGKRLVRRCMLRVGLWTIPDSVLPAFLHYYMYMRLRTAQPKGAKEMDKGAPYATLAKNAHTSISP